MGSVPAGDGEFLYVKAEAPLVRHHDGTNIARDTYSLDRIDCFLCRSRISSDFGNEHDGYDILLSTYRI